MGVKNAEAKALERKKPRDTYDIEVNIMIDYRTDRTWASIKLEFDNDAGTLSGSFDHLTLERAFFGARVVDKDLYTMDLEVGRRRLTYTFDSRVQFNSFMDGILFKYDHALDRVGDLYFHGGPFLVDEGNDIYSFIWELGLLNIAQTGLYAKYSMIDWHTKEVSPRTKTQNYERQNDRLRFFNSQFTIGYKFVPKWLGKIVTLYAAFLINHAADTKFSTVYVTNSDGRAIKTDGNLTPEADQKQFDVTCGNRANLAWYVGFSAGEARKKGDWSFDANFQLVQAQAIPEFDVSGIGHGNTDKVGFYTKKLEGEGGPQTKHNAIGETNYYGYVLQFFYLFTNNLTLYQNWMQSWTLNNCMSPSILYKQYEIELIYAF